MHPECKECTCKKFRQYSKDFRDELQVTRKIRDNKNKDHFLNYQKEYYQEHKEQEQEKQRNYQQNNPDKMKQYQENREKTKHHEISNTEWIACKNYFGNCCAYCGLPLDKHLHMKNGKLILFDFCKDHKDNEGANDLSNCIPACKSCNSKKWKSTLEEWYNENNPIFNKERYNKILKWLNVDYKLHIEEKKPYVIIRERNNNSLSFHFNLWEVDDQCKLIKIIATKSKKKDLKEDIEKFLESKLETK